ncbi:FRG domain-containing protein [Avibacterium avium]|uniref:FRG domain-containing protein n=1 Tax=Avibacterium avium TaxID=751 RepID=UPI003BF91E50
MNNENFFDEITINTLDEFNEYIKENFSLTLKENDIEPPSELELVYIRNQDSTSFFRGHSKESYELKSTLEREIDKYGVGNISPEEYLHIQKNYLEKCKTLLRGKFSEQSLLLNKEFDDEIWAIGQHFGLKTPLLDWSYSFWIALFFAFREQNTDTKNINKEECLCNQIHNKVCYNLFKNQISNKDKEEITYRVVYHLHTFMNFDVQIIEPKIDFGGRINAQKGVFTKYLCSELLEINKKHNTHREKNSHIKIQGLLTKIRINSSLRPKILEFLDSININNSVLFPDITGAIEDCHLALHNILQLETLPD